MAVSLFDVTYTDIEVALDGFKLSGDITEVAKVIKRKASIVNAKLRKIGESLVSITSTSDETGYEYVREIIILLASAEIAQRWTQQDPDLSTAREEQAVLLMKEMRDAPEAVFESWDPTDHLGTVKASRVLTELSPGGGTGAHRVPWGEVF